MLKCLLVLEYSYSDLDGSLLRYEVGSGTIPGEILAKIDSDKAGDGTHPISVDLPYADEMCHIDVEASKCKGMPVVGLAYGTDCFNFCFPERRELETMIIPADDGRPALRVFWEQW